MAWLHRGLPAQDSRHYFVMGAVSKGLATITTYPFQVVKARLQQRFDDGRKPYSGVADCVTRTLRYVHVAAPTLCIWVRCRRGPPVVGPCTGPLGWRSDMHVLFTLRCRS